MAHTTRSISVACGFFALLGGLGIAWAEGVEEPAGDEPPIVVHLVNGQTLAADIAPQTDETRLWLRWSRSSAEVLRPIAWPEVAQAWVLGQEVSGEQLHQLVVKIRQRVPAAAPERPARLILEGSSSEAELPPRIELPPPRVRHLAIEVVLAGWSDTVEADGLVVHVFPVDAQGRIVPVDGTLEVDLTGWQPTAPLVAQPFPGLGRWTQRVRPEDFGPAGAVYRFPFQAVHPEFELSVAPRGMVHARLSVAGHGTFDASGDVRIRAFSAVRDQLQRVTGQRFLPQERKGRVK